MKQLLLLFVSAALLCFVPKPKHKHSETGTASFYAKKFEGRRCSSGEVFRNDSLTAAHKTLPFGTIVKVTNLKNDSCVLLRINDRLPKSSKRKIDITRRAAGQLNFLQNGLAKVKIEVVSGSESQ